MRRDLSEGKVVKPHSINYTNVYFSTIHKFEAVYAVIFTRKEGFMQRFRGEKENEFVYPEG